MNKVAIANWSELKDRTPAYALVGNVDLVVIRYDPEVSVFYGRCLHRGIEADSVVYNISTIERGTAGKMGQKTGKQRHISIRADGEVHIGNICAHRPARIDDHHLHVRPRRLCGSKPLIEDGMTPGEIGSGEDYQIGKLHILIGAGHRIGPEGAAMAGDRRRHAKP